MEVGCSTAVPSLLSRADVPHRRLTSTAPPPRSGARTARGSTPHRHGLWRPRRSVDLGVVQKVFEGPLPGDAALGVHGFAVVMTHLNCRGQRQRMQWGRVFQWHGHLRPNRCRQRCQGRGCMCRRGRRRPQVRTRVQLQRQWRQRRWSLTVGPNATQHLAMAWYHGWRWGRQGLLPSTLFVVRPVPELIRPVHQAGIGVARSGAAGTAGL